MGRKKILKTGLLPGGAALVPNTSAIAQNLTENNIDKLVDKDGNFFHQPLAYANNHLEPYMDEETLYLHYAFHHGGAVNGANKHSLFLVETPFLALFFRSQKPNYPHFHCPGRRCIGIC